MKLIKTVRLKSSDKPGTQSVYYYSFVFLNYRGEQLLYMCTAVSLKLAMKQFKKYMGSAPYTLKGVTAAGPYIFYTAT